MSCVQMFQSVLSVVLVEIKVLKMQRFHHLEIAKIFSKLHANFAV